MFEFLAEMADVYVESTVIWCGIPFKQAHRDLLARYDPPRGTDQQFENVKLQRREIDHPSFRPHLAGLHIDLKVAKGFDGLVGAAFQPARPPQHCSNPCQQFIGIERLRQIIIRAGIQTQNPILPMYARR